MADKSFSIEPLSKATLKEAGALANKVLPGEFPPPSVAFRVSLIPTLKRLYGFLGRMGLTPGEQDFEYWVAKQDGKVVGTTGLYSMIKDPDAKWLGWHAVDPEARKQGIGKGLLEHSIGEARKSGAKVLKLYTSEHPNEAVAQKMYDRYGFEIVERVKEKREEYHTLFRQLVLDEIEKDLPAEQPNSSLPPYNPNS